MTLRKIELYLTNKHSYLWILWIVFFPIVYGIVAILSLILMPFCWLLGIAKDTEMDKMIRAEEKQHYGR